jgi:hypothetical protein
MMTHFEIYFPELVSWVQRIYISQIHPIAEKTAGIEVKSISISENKEFDEIRKIFHTFKEFMQPHFLVFNLKPNSVTPLHMDGYEENRRRTVSLNIPISGCDSNGVTEFYDCPEENFFGDRIYKTHWLKPGRSEGTKIDEYSLSLNPIVICPQIPHKIINKSSVNNRISVSWTIKAGWYLTDAYEYFKNQNKILS